MSTYTLTPAENGDLEQIGRVQVAVAKLKPACTQCGRTLTKRELDERRCSNHEDCRLRQIFAGPKFRDGKPLNLGEVHARQKFLADKRDLAVSA